MAEPYKRQENKEEIRKAIAESNKEPDLEFIADETNKIMLSNSILAQFCPHLEYCQVEDTNCFFEKFFHCEEARHLELIRQLSQVNKFYLKYRGQILNGEYPIQLRR